MGAGQGCVLLDIQRSGCSGLEQGRVNLMDFVGNAIAMKTPTATGRKETASFGRKKPQQSPSCCCLIASDSENCCLWQRLVHFITFFPLLFWRRCFALCFQLFGIAAPVLQTVLAPLVSSVWGTSSGAKNHRTGLVERDLLDHRVKLSFLVPQTNTFWRDASVSLFLK